MTSLPYADADDHLRALACCAEGFGRMAIGGLHGAIYSVTSLAGLLVPIDDGPGSLREGCRRKEPLWIVFDVSGTIELKTFLSVSSYKTIDGRGQRIKFTGKGLRLKECEHIIISNLEFQGGRGHDVDGIQIKPNSRHIWIDRCSLRDYDDGLIDITRQSTDVTVSRFPSLGVTLLNMTRPCLSGQTLLMWVIDASGSQFTIVSSMELARDSLVLDLGKFISITITLGIGQSMLSVLALKLRFSRNATSTKQQRRKRPLNIIQRRLQMHKRPSLAVSNL
ncbi:Putative pectate lyase 21 [Linum grandiflorum]